MSRARNVKPAFFSNEDLVEMPFEYRLLFIGLWTLADREGRLEDRPKRIKMQVFPADDVDIEAGLTALHSAGMVQRYTVNENRYISIPAWKKHQNPHCREAPSKIPPPGKSGANTEQAPGRHGASPADSLIPDSLIQEQKLTSPVGSSENLAHGRDETPPPTDRPQTPVPANALACKAMREAGAVRVNPTHPVLLAGIAEGATPSMYGDAVREAIEAHKGEPFAYAIAAVRNRIAEQARNPVPGGSRANRSQGRKLSAVEQVEQSILERRERDARAAIAGPD